MSQEEEVETLTKSVEVTSPLAASTGVVADVVTASPKLEFLVLDANAFIRGHGLDLYHKAKRMVTVQEVLSEVRDVKAQSVLATLPFELEILSPSAEAVKAVADYARQTGDFRSLSKTDLRLVALAYHLYTQTHGHPPKHRQLATIVPQKKKLVSQQKTTSVTVSATVNEIESENQEVEEHVVVVKEEEEEDESEEFEEDSEEEDESDRESDDEDTLPVEDSVDGNVLVESMQQQSLDFPVNCWANVLRRAQSAPTSAPVKPASMPVPEPESAPEAVIEAPTSTDSDVKLTNVEDSTVSIAATVAPSEPVQQQEKENKKEVKEAATQPKGKTAKAKPSKATHTKPTHKVISTAIIDNQSRQMAAEDDGQGWISMSNMNAQSAFDAFQTVSSKSSNTQTKKKKQQQQRRKTKEEESLANEEASARVACFTTDFSMQNVLLQLGLRVVSSDGMFVRTARQWVLRCLGCHSVHTKDLTRLFCAQCGLHHLQRIAASVDAVTGELRLHLKKNYRMDTSGMQYSLPAPGKQGRFQGELLLREDQLLSGIWRQKSVKMQRDVKSAFGEDVVSQVGLQLNKLESEIVVGWGRQNPNARRGRERRGKKKNAQH